MKKVIAFATALLLAPVFFISCTKKSDKEIKSKSSQEEVSDSKTEESDGKKEAPAESAKAEKEIVWFGEESTPFDKANLTDAPTSFSEFSTVLAIGDQIVIPQDCDVYKSPNSQAFNESPGKLKEGSTVHLLYQDQDKNWLCFVDEKGNSAWAKTSIPFKQRQYTSKDSIIRKLWEKDGFDLAAFSPDGKTVAFHRWDYRFSSEKGLCVCDRATGEELFVTEAKPRSRIAMAYSPDGEYIYYVRDDKYLMQVCIKDKTQKDLGSPTPYQASINDHSEFLQSIHPLPDGENILCGVYYESWAMYNLKTQSWTYKTGGDFMWANSFAFSPDGKYIAGSAGNPTDLCVWKMDTREIVWQKMRDFGGDLYYSADGKTLYVVNGTGITALNALTGEEISKAYIEFPYHYNIYSWQVIPKKDRALFTVNEEKSGQYDSEHGLTYLYAYELSTGKLVQAEHIEDAGKKIEALAISPDGKYISIRIKDGSHVNECHQVICAVNLDKKAKEMPSVKRSKDEEKSRRFLLENSFTAGWWRLSFYPNGVYGLWARHDGTMTGNWILKKSERRDGYYEVALSTPMHGGKEEPYSFTNQYNMQASFPGEYMVYPDYEDFDCKGSLGAYDDGDPILQSERPSPAWKTYYYKGENVLKYPGWGDKDAKYLTVLENTKMRKEPSLNAETVSLAYYDYKNEKYIENRNVVYAGQVIRIIGATERKETIDGKTAPWYLIYEDDHNGGEFTEGSLVWVYGGYSYESDLKDAK